MKQPQKNDLGSYADFLDALIEQGYDFIFYHELDPTLKSQVIMRHDIDFDTGFALETAKIEHAKGVKATYFFMMRSTFYNILCKDDFENIKEIQRLGHDISVHFDPTVYNEDFTNGLVLEAGLFEYSFDKKVKMISFHRPTEFFLNHDEPIAGIEHTYQSKYFNDLKYFSDSTGVWRFGCPTDSTEFKQGESLHILTHPVWWVLDGASNLDKLRSYYAQRTDLLKKDFFNNCKPFRQIHASL